MIRPSLVILAALASALAAAEEIELELKDGRKVKAEVVAEDKEGVTLKVKAAKADLAARGDAPAIAAGPHAAFLDAVGGVLIDKDGVKVDKEVVARCRWLVLFFGAGSDTDSRSLASSLVSFYSTNRGENLFEVIYISSDKNGEEQLKFMKDASMPWLTVRFGSSKVAKLRKQYDTRGNASQAGPCLVVVDDKGAVAAHTFVQGRNVGCAQVLKDFEKMIKEQATPAK